MNPGDLILAVPSKGRLMDDTMNLFADAGIVIEKVGDQRGYRGAIQDMENVSVAFLSASEIARELKAGRVHMGVTGEDLIRENIEDVDEAVEFVGTLGFGHADIVVAVPACWIDVQTMAELEEVCAAFHRTHQRRLRVATKYLNVTRAYFADKGVTGYRIVESLGATEGTPTSGTAEVIVDITSTGSTLKANHLKILKDGVILKSEANLLVSRKADWTDRACEARTIILERLAG